MIISTRKNPKTGKLETYEVPAPPDLEASRKELRDFIHGNYQWYDDPYKAPPPPPKKEEEVNMDDLDNQYADFYHNYSRDIQ